MGEEGGSLTSQKTREGKEERGESEKEEKRKREREGGREKGGMCIYVQCPLAHCKPAKIIPLLPKTYVLRNGRSICRETATPLPPQTKTSG